jgi:hypothetical protein
VNAVLPMYSGLRSAICLHASAVTRDGFGRVFAGPSGSGKSTRAWRELQAGALNLADDAVVLRPVDRSWFVFPGARTLRLLSPPGPRSWRSGSKFEAYVPSTQSPVPLGRIVLIGSKGEEARSLTAAGVLRALLALQHGWVWGNARTRLLLLDLTAALCAQVDWAEREIDRALARDSAGLGGE